METPIGSRLEASLLALRKRALVRLLARDRVAISEPEIERQLSSMSDREIVRHYRQPQRHMVGRIYAFLRRLRGKALHHASENS